MSLLDPQPKPKPIPRKTRAVLRRIEPGGEMVMCAHCGERVKFVAKKRAYKVIANIYKNRKWNRVEQFHRDCYEAAGSPHGEALA